MSSENYWSQTEQHCAHFSWACCWIASFISTLCKLPSLAIAWSTRQIMLWNATIYTTFNSCLILFWLLHKPQVTSTSSSHNGWRKWPASTASSHLSRQNHRMVWVGRNLKDHLVPTPLPWAGTPAWTSSTPTCQFERQRSKQISRF